MLHICPILDEIHQSMWKIEQNVNLFSQQQQQQQQPAVGQSDPYFYCGYFINEPVMDNST